MAGVVVGNAQVGLQFVRIDRLGLILDGPCNEGMERLPLHVRYSFQSDMPVPLDCAGHDRFILLVASALPSGLPSHKGLVNLHDTHQRRPLQGIVAHCFPYAVTQIPGRLVRHA